MGTPKMVPDALALGTEKMCDDASNDVKQISVRLGARNYTVGNTLILYNEEFGFVASATTDDVRHCTLADVSDEEYRADGFGSLDEMLAGLQQFYGDSITLGSEVTVLRWSGIKGPQVDARHQQ